MSPEQREKHLKAIERIELATRPEKWRLIKKLVLELHPGFKIADKEFSEACKELRQKTESQTASSKSGDLRNTMKIPSYIYNAMVKLDPDLMAEMSGRNRGDQKQIGKQLYQAFPEYRIARKL